MQNQEANEEETHWRVKTPLEADYEAVINGNGDRLEVIEEIMHTAVTNNLKKTTISYNKKSKSANFSNFDKFYRKTEIAKESCGKCSQKDGPRRLRPLEEKMRRIRILACKINDHDER